jgi:DNA repair protein SbcC/Rad50
MQLHSMTIQAIGPFAGRHTVDFAALSSSGIFLLEGPTGAGKSTLIDAVVFALYGKVASPLTSDDRLRSAYASDDTDSYVDLTFETSAGVYRVFRTPERQRPKKRGTGNTKQQASVKLWRLPADAVMPGNTASELGEVGELHSTRLDEVGLELQRIIGLDRMQFVQTIVLPQGEFASFLRAEPEDRRGLLQKVFGTQIYDRAQAELAAMRQGAKQTLHDSQARLAAAIDAFASTAALDDEEASRLREAPAEHVGKLAAEHCGEIADAAAQLVARDATARVAVDTARGVLDAGRRTVATAQRRDTLRSEQARLADQAEAIVACEARLARARRAERVQPSVDGARSAWESLRAAVADFHEAVDQAGLVVEVPEPLSAWGRSMLEARDHASQTRATGDGARDAAEAVRTLGEQRERDSSQAVLLGRLVDVERGLPARRSQVEAESSALEALRAELVELSNVLASRPSERIELERVRDDLRQRAAELPVFAEKVGREQKVLDAVVRSEALAAQYEEAQLECRAAARSAQEAVNEERAVRSARIAGIAVELASNLGADDPCPVCGSREHPEPATPDGDHVGQDDVDAAEARRRAAEDSLAAADRRVTQLMERLEVQRDLAGGVDRAGATDALEQAKIAESAARAAQREADTATAALLDFDAATHARAGEHKELSEELAVRSTTLEHLKVSIVADAKEIAEALVEARSARRAVTGSEASIVALVDELTARIEAVDGLLVAHARATQARSVHRTREEECFRVLSGHGFATVTEAAAATRPAADMARDDEDLAEYRASSARVAAGLSEPEILALPDEIAVDLDHLVGEASRAEEQARDLSQAAAIAGRRALEVERASQSMAAAVTHLDSAQVAAGPVIRMADLAAGTSSDNARRLTLATFVLLRRFEDVVAAANDRLVTMSEGRFELMRSDEREDVRSRRTGLAMKVIDHYTESARDPRTLSGGETFYVSLCLALGMADVVTAEAGGIDLGTLFVDEGFGSLDPETLDAVLRVLGGLRTGGRVVGVVSHVEALKQSIADGVSVRRLADGSSTLTVRAG